MNTLGNKPFKSISSCSHVLWRLVAAHPTTSHSVFPNNTQKCRHLEEKGTNCRFLLYSEAESSLISQRKL